MRLALALACALWFAAPVRSQCEMEKVIGTGVKNQDQFAYSVDIDGTAAVAGCIKCDDNGGESGTAFVFRFDGHKWVEEDVLLASDGTAFDQMGWSSAIDGTTVIAGAHQADLGGGANNAGAAYVFVKTAGSTWLQETKLTAADAEGGDRFGQYVALSGDVAVVGAHLEDEAANNAGAVYVFRRTGRSWIQEAKLMADDATAGDQFGYSVAVDGDTIVVGAWQDDPSGQSGAGSAYVFKWDGATWNQEAKLVANDASAGDEFGTAVTVQENRLLVGAPRNDDGGFGTNADTGSVYFYMSTVPGTWNQIEKVNTSPASRRFGAAFAMDGLEMVVGAFLDPDNGIDAGAFYTYKWMGGTWTEVSKKYNSDIEPFDETGGSVGLSGDFAIVSSDFEDQAGWNAGAGYFYDLSGEYCLPLYTWPDTISVTDGGTQYWTIREPAYDSTYLYWVVGSKNNAPGINVDGVPIPLNWDAYFQFTVNKADTMTFPSSVGNLTDAGYAEARVVLPAGTDPALVGLVLYHSAVVFEMPSFTAQSATPERSLTLTF